MPGGADTTPPFDCDYLVVGSGFGGAAAALRLAEKRHRVIVLEQGRHIGPDQVAASRRRVSKLLWRPGLRLTGFFWRRSFRHITIIGAAGVGGGSLVFGGVLIQPTPASFDDPAWARTRVDWQAELAPCYQTAKRMLGCTVNRALGTMDDHLRATATRMGVGDTFGPVPLAIYFGDPGRTAPDPYFDGAGPSRTGCLLCGGCLMGCPHGAKNSLDHNYLHLAQRHGAQVRAEHEVVRIEPLPGGGYRVHSRNPIRRRQRRVVLRARNVVLAAGVLGTLELLFRSRDVDRTLPNVSHQLGHTVRTNSEAMPAILSHDPGTDLTRGPAISSDFYPDPATHVIQNRAAGNQGMMRWQLGPLVDGPRPLWRAVRTVGLMLARPARTLRVLGARRLPQRITVLTVMQQCDNELRFRYGRSPLAPWRRRLRSARGLGVSAPSYLPIANQVARMFAEVSGGEPLNMLAESLHGTAVTAHILGGAIIGASAADSVVDSRHQVHGHPGLYVVDASTIPANLGVNPSLTIAAMAERFTSLVAPGNDGA